MNTTSLRASLQGVTCSRTALVAFLFLVSITLFSASLSAQTTDATRGNFDLATGRLCFPVELTETAQQYDVCFQLEESDGNFLFRVASASKRAGLLDNPPTYSQQTGLQIPVVRFSNGKVFADASFTAALDAGTGDVVFNLTGGEAAKLDKAHSIARIWNEELLDGIRNDLARPTVHSRNLFHTSALMYDGWAVFDDVADTYLLGKTVHGFACPYDGMPAPTDVAEARRQVISFAAYRLLSHRFAKAPGAAKVSKSFDHTMAALGYDRNFTSTDYSTGNAAALGNYLAQCMIDYGLQDGANEQNNYAALYYQAVNDSMAPTVKGNPTMSDPNRWQPLSFEVFRDQSGNIFLGNTPPFVGPEWGMVQPFSLTQDDLTIHQRDGVRWYVYHDPGPPPFIDDKFLGLPTGEYYKWGFELVAQWSSHLDPNDGVMWDISPASFGNIQQYPTTLSQYKNFYKAEEGGDPSVGYEINPYTGEPYEPQIVPRGDYTRVLAEFWADGPDSETPPGHWFTILNYVSDHPLLEKRYKGEGPVLDDLEWDVKAYFTLGGAMHDTAVTSWGIKGWYDYVRPVSAIRYMADRGQSSDPGAMSYDPEGIQLKPGFIELVLAGDPLAGPDNENVGKIKLKAWRGPDYVPDPETDYAGVGWILAENWWPYQRPTFVTPPFAGYVSGHSTFSRSAAHVMTLLTGDAYFPGGLGEFHAPKNEFLVFEEGPSVDLVLQWATYQDASDQTSLSRIWGGIHPPADDIPGRHIGDAVGPEAFGMAESYFNGVAGD